MGTKVTCTLYIKFPKHNGWTTVLAMVYITIFSQLFSKECSFISQISYLLVLKISLFYYSLFLHMILIKFSALKVYTSNINVVDSLYVEPVEVFCC